MGVDCNKHLQSTVKHIFIMKYTVATSRQRNTEAGICSANSSRQQLEG
jgi:hypothetical protein